MVAGDKTGKTGKVDARAARKARLAAALRENLKRRKQQARERAEKHKSPSADVMSQDGQRDGEQDHEAARGGPEFRRNRGGE